MARFKVGDKVRWVRAVFPPELQNTVGTVTAVYPKDRDYDETTIYDITFPLGKFTLSGTHIEHE
jgi:hypothetical protein